MVKSSIRIRGKYKGLGGPALEGMIQAEKENRMKKLKVSKVKPTTYAKSTKNAMKHKSKKFKV